MNKLSSTSYRALFFKHVFRFLGNVTSPNELIGSHVIAVSGGVDSMALLWFAHGLSKQILHAKDLESKIGNFEGRARKERRALLLNDLLPGESLWLGHHIDDSYEWSIMQRYRSGQPKSSLGIPVRNGKIIRPFLCVTKEQLLHLSRFENIVFRNDPTNKETKYDRNFVRESLAPLIKKRFPKYLKHYVNHANHMAVILHLNITNRVNENQIHLYEQGAIIQGPQFSQYQVQELLHSFSNSERGEITAQILKMFTIINIKYYQKLEKK